MRIANKRRGRVGKIVGRANERQGRGGKMVGRANGKRSRERRGMTRDPSAPMGRRDFRRWGFAKVGAEVGEDGTSVFGDGAVARAAAVKRRRLRRRGTPVVPDRMKGGTTGGGRGGRGRRGDTCCRAGIG